MNKDELAKVFEEIDLEPLAPYSQMGILSTQDEGGIYPPYVPRIGEDYRTGGIALYGTAQSIDKPWDSLREKSKTKKVLQLQDAMDKKDVWIAPYQVMLGAAGMHLLAKEGRIVESLDELHRIVVATNYYKFSLSQGGKDINPELELPGTDAQKAEYRALNDRLVTLELTALKPSVVITFRGRHLEVLKRQVPAVLQINDPSWILQGARGVLKSGKSWDREHADPQARALAISYAGQITHERYRAKADSVAIYLLKYWADWCPG
ncbi:MAG: hypothetical protein RL318_1808 [Fibrobacterota bacterium]|jgi:hypothetical protein